MVLVDVDGEVDLNWLDTLEVISEAVLVGEYARCMLSFLRNVEFSIKHRKLCEKRVENCSVFDRPSSINPNSQD